MRDGFIDSLTFYADGSIGTSPTNGNLPSVCSMPLSLLPESRWNMLPESCSPSVFWYAFTPSNSLLATWQNAAAGRDASCPVSVQAEFHANGDFEYRTEDAVTRYQVVTDFDYDGDGIVNDQDPDPRMAGADAHGTNAEWYLTVCSNVFEAVNGPGGLEVAWRAGVNSNAYYFVDAVVSNGPVVVAFDSDTESRLGNPAVVALPGVTNRVPLLIGVNYSISSELPFELTVPTNGMVSVITNSPSRYTVKWPVDFHFYQDVTITNGVGYVVDVEPTGLGGDFSWEGSIPESEFCGGTGGGGQGPLMLAGFSGGCGYSGYGNSFVYNCSGECGCGGCYATGYYTYENVWIPIAGGHCGCSPDDDEDDDDDHSHEHCDEPQEELVPPSVIVSFSEPAVIFEDQYQDSPGVWIGKRSTTVLLNVHAYGGSKGGALSFFVQNLECLATNDGYGIPIIDQTLGAGETYSLQVECIGSGNGGVVSIVGEISGEDGGSSSDDHLSVVRVGISEVYHALINPCSSRHTYGVCEKVQLLCSPASFGVNWSNSNNCDFECVNGGITFLCPEYGQNCSLEATMSGVSLPIPINIIEPRSIECDYAENLSVDLMKGAGMFLRLSVSPFNVSFEGLDMEEVPADNANWQNWGSHDGYFSDQAFSGKWCHTRTWGAGRWCRISGFNVMGWDESRMMVWPQPWMNGTMSWKIPYGWRRGGSSLDVCAGQIMPPSYSCWSMTTNLVKKTKHGYHIGQYSDGRTFFGRIQDGQ